MKEHLPSCDIWIFELLDTSLEKRYSLFQDLRPRTALIVRVLAIFGTLSTYALDTERSLTVAFLRLRVSRGLHHTPGSAELTIFLRLLEMRHVR
jgi:hypothetical protein